MSFNFNPEYINEKVEKEINYFLKDEPELKTDVSYAYKIAIPDRPKAYLMLQFANVLKIDRSRILPFVIVADLMMAAAMNTDDIIDNSSERCNEQPLWKIKGTNSTVTVTDYMYTLIFSILKKYRPHIDDSDFLAYQKSENLLLDYFREMGIAQYKTTISKNHLSKLKLKDVQKLSERKASLLFQFCSAVPAYFAGKYVKELENFGYQLGIARQYISDIQDFLEISGDTYKKGVRMEDYFSHQPNLVLVLTGTSDKLSKEDKKWFYDQWSNSVSEEDKNSITERVTNLINQTDAIKETKKEVKKIKDNLQKSLSILPDEEFKQSMSKWAFRSFPIN